MTTFLQVFPQDPAAPLEDRLTGPLRLYNWPEQRWVLENASEEQVLDALAEAAAERQRSAGVKAIASARRENPSAPPPNPPE